MADVTRLAFFLITLHVLFFGASLAGLRPAQSGVSQDQAFVENMSSGQIQDSVAGTNTSRIIRTDFTVSLESIGFIDAVTGILFSPYDAISNSDIPGFFKLLFGGLLGFAEAAVAASFLRGIG